MRKPRRIMNYGSEALLLEWEQRIDKSLNRSVHTYSKALSQWPEIIDCVPSYASLLVVFIPTPGLQNALRERIYDAQPALGDQPIIGARHELPVLYGGAYGPDLAFVSETCGLSREEIIHKHTAISYNVYQLGYVPGFAFLGVTDPELEVPRRVTPRTRVPAGSVALAGRQTAVYPSESPGGWQLIGRCPLALLDLQAKTAERVSRLHPGDEVSFVSIDEPTYHRLLKTPSAWPV